MPHREREIRTIAKSILDSITAVNDVCAHINGIIRQKHQNVIIFDLDMTHAVALFFHVPFFCHHFGHTYEQKYKYMYTEICVQTLLCIVFVNGEFVINFLVVELHQMRHPVHKTQHLYVDCRRCHYVRSEYTICKRDLLFKLWIDILDNEYKVNRTRAMNNIHTLHFTQIAVIKSRWREKVNDMRAKDWKWNSEFKWSDRVQPNSRTISRIVAVVILLHH